MLAINLILESISHELWKNDSKVSSSKVEFGKFEALKLLKEELARVNVCKQIATDVCVVFL